MSFKDYTKEEQNRIRDMFNFLDKDNSGKIPIDQVKMGIIGLGGELNNKELSELQSKSKLFKFEDFINLCKRKKIDINEIEKKLLKAFSLLETKEKGYIPSASLEILLRNDNVSESDITKIINEAKPDKKKNIDYQNLVKDIMEANSDDEDNDNIKFEENNINNNNKEDSD